MGKLGKKVRKENVSLMCEKDLLNQELLKVKKCNSELIEIIKHSTKDFYEQLCENDILVKENRKLKEEFKLFDEVKKVNEDLEKKLKLLEKENKILKSKPIVCDVACDTSDLCPLVDTDDVPKVFIGENCEVECKDVFACTSAGCDIKNKGYS